MRTHGRPGRPAYGSPRPLTYPSPSALSPAQNLLDPIDVVDAAAPGAAADVLQRGPQPRVVGEVGVGLEVDRPAAVRPGLARLLRERARSSGVADEVDACR